MARRSKQIQKEFYFGPCKIQYYVDTQSRSADGDLEQQIKDF